jgi:hypothetical protein
MAQIVASIEYETASPPAGLPDDMQALPGASLRFLSIKAIDGLVRAALWQSETKPPVDTTIIVQLHGSGGNLASLPAAGNRSRLVSERIRGPQHQHAAARRACEWLRWPMPCQLGSRSRICDAGGGIRVPNALTGSGRASAPALLTCTAARFRR